MRYHAGSKSIEQDRVILTQTKSLIASRRIQPSDVETWHNIPIHIRQDFLLPPSILPFCNIINISYKIQVSVFFNY